MILSEGLVNMLDQYRVDAVLFHWLSYDVPALAAQICRRSIPYAVVHHFDNSRLQSKLAQRMTLGASAVGGVSAQGVPAYLRGKYANLSDAVDVSFFAPGSANALDGPAGFVVLLPSRIAQGKGHRDLLQAGKTLALEGLDITIAFAGAVESESLLAELKDQVASLNMVGRVVFLGELERESLRDWYAHSDLVVLPSWSEGLGRVLLEAQAMGRPVIAYATGGTPDALVNGTTGYLVEKGNSSALAERIMYLARHPTERAVMGQSASKFVLDRYAADALVRRHEDFLRVVLGQRSTT
jgi:glycosyltransferase involved in cell wall biosynthesis